MERNIGQRLTEKDVNGWKQTKTNRTGQGNGIEEEIKKKSPDGRTEIDRNRQKQTELDKEMEWKKKLKKIIRWQDIIPGTS